MVRTPEQLAAAVVVSPEPEPLYEGARAVWGGVPEYRTVHRLTMTMTEWHSVTDVVQSATRSAHEQWKPLMHGALRARFGKVPDPILVTFDFGPEAVSECKACGPYGGTHQPGKPNPFCLCWCHA